MRPAPIHRLPWSLLLLLLAACGGGGGGGGSPSEPPPPQAGITYTAGSAASQNGIAVVQGTGGNANTLVLEVRANGVTDLYGVAFDLTFPGNLLQNASISQGAFLTGGSFQYAASSGRLVIGLSRLGAVRGVAGSGVLLTASFSATAAGDGTIAFANNAAFDSTGAPIPITWSGGSVHVTR
jgi:hypothetical protein